MRSLYSALKLARNEMGPSKIAFFPCVEDPTGPAGSLVKAHGHTPSSAGTLAYFLCCWIFGDVSEDQ
jgi:hypothetical protein